MRGRLILMALLGLAGPAACGEQRMGADQQIALVERCERLLKEAGRARAAQADVEATQAAFAQHARQHFKFCQGPVDDAIVGSAHAAAVAIAFMRETPALGHVARLKARRAHPATGDHARQRLDAALAALEPAP